MTIVRIEYIDPAWETGSRDYWGKVVATSDVRGMTRDEIATEVAEMKELLGDYVVAVEVEEIPAIGGA